MPYRLGLECHQNWTPLPRVGFQLHPPQWCSQPPEPLPRKKRRKYAIVRFSDDVIEFEVDSAQIKCR